METQIHFYPRIDMHGGYETKDVNFELFIVSDVRIEAEGSRNQDRVLRGIEDILKMVRPAERVYFKFSYDDLAKEIKESELGKRKLASCGLSSLEYRK